MWKKIRRAGGFTLIAFGLLGTLLPIMPGIPLIIAGIALVGSEHPWVRPFVPRLRSRRRDTDGRP